MKTTSKKRIFIANDASFLNTGYAIYGKEILTRLHNSGKYEVAELGLYCDAKNPSIKNIPWKFYPNAVGIQDDRYARYKSNNLNQFGLWRFNRCLVDFKPHIVFDIKDYWMFSYQETSPYKKYFNWIIMPATDSAPPKLEWLYTFSNADMVVPYTQWAKNTLSNACGKHINLFPKIANAGINPEEFYPIENKAEHKKKYFGKDLAVTGLVMRNQKRKLLPDILLVFKKYLESLKQSGLTELYNNSVLYLHTTYPEENGWSLPELLLEYEVLDRVYLTYFCRKCNKFFPAKFQNSLTVCKHCNSKTATVSNAMNGVDTKQLNEIYNLFDLFIQYAICEGFGMPQVEAAACGLQIASVDYSAMSEIAESVNGIKIPVNRIFRELETNAERVYPDNDATTKIIYDFFVNTSADTKSANSIDIRNKCISKYTWDNVYSVWEECFDSIDISIKPSWLSEPDPTRHQDLRVPLNLTNLEFIDYICYQIINSPELLDTANIQSLIRNASCGIVAKDGNMTTLTRHQIVDMLENHLNNKIICNIMRTDPSSLTNEDFLTQ